MVGRPSASLPGLLESLTVPARAWGQLGLPSQNFLSKLPQTGKKYVREYFASIANSARGAETSGGESEEEDPEGGSGLVHRQARQEASSNCEAQKI